MKKAVLIYVFLVVIIVLNGISLYLMNKSDELQSITLDSDNVRKINNYLYDSYVVSCMNFYNYKTYPAEFFYSEDAVISISSGNQKAQSDVKPGDMINRGDVLYRIGEKEVKSNSQYRCLKIEKNDNDIQMILLDLTKVEIKCNVPLSLVLADMDSYEYTLKQENSANISLKRIETNYGEEYASLYFDFESDTEIRYSDEFYVRICIEKKNDSVVVPTDYIFCSGDINLCKVNKNVNGEIQVVEISIGLISDGNAEITEGLSEGDVLVSVDKESCLTAFLSD